MSLSLPSAPTVDRLDTGHLASDRVAAMRGVVASAWHGLWQLATTSPWVAIAVMVPAVAVLVGCTRVTVRRN